MYIYTYITLNIRKAVANQFFISLTSLLPIIHSFL